MNKSELLEHFKEVLIDAINLSDSFEVQDIFCNLQDAGQNDLVFYYIRDGEKSKQLFLDRYKKSNRPILVLNKVIDEIKTEKNIVIIDYKEFLETEKRILDHFYPNKNTLKIAAVTGTNGKTSVVNMCMQIATSLGEKAASLGTLGIIDSNGAIKDSGWITSPSYIDLRKIIYELQDEYKILFLEASSHALEQDRFFDVRFDIAAWTNFTQDHLNYHKTMENYFNCKCLVFTKYLKENGKFYVLKSENDLKIKLNKYLETRPVRDLIKSEIPRELSFSFNYKNLELAVNICKELVNNISTLELENIIVPKGRFSQIVYGTNKIVIDYAHTPDAIYNICDAVREEIGNKRLVVLFGCGGDRDKTKRPLMAKVVEQFGDLIIITSDNPRFENELIIIDDILKGFSSMDKILVIADRKEAIKRGIENLKGESVLIIAGKGDEDYLDIKGVKHPFSDFDEVYKLIGLT